jgi:hypothetical protein
MMEFTPQYKAKGTYVNGQIKVQRPVRANDTTKVYFVFDDSILPTQFDKTTLDAFILELQELRTKLDEIEIEVTS